MSAFLDAVADGQKWNDPKISTLYRDMLDSFRQRNADACMKEISGAEDLRSLAADVLDQLEARWKGFPFLSRSGKQEDDKLKIVTFLLPMLLDTGDPACIAFVSAFQEEWNGRYPKWILRAASGEEIAGGFRRTFLGFQLPDKNKNN